MPIDEERLYEIIHQTWASTLGFPVQRVASGESSEVRAFTVCVRVSGAWEGEVRLQSSPRLARLIASAIFQVDAEKAESDEIIDALCELIHIVGGNLKPLMPQPVSVSLPFGLDNDHPEPAGPSGQILFELTLTSEGHPFVITLRESPTSPSRAETTTREGCRPPAPPGVILEAGRQGAEKVHGTSSGLVGKR